MSGRRKLMVRKFAQVTHRADSVPEAGWFERTAHALAEVARASRTGGPARIAIPGHLTLTKLVRTHSVALPRRGQVIEFEAAQAIPHPLADVVWEHQLVEDDGCTLELRFTAVRREAMERICQAVSDAGYRVSGALAPLDPLERALQWNYPEVTGPVLVADIGARTTTVAIIGPGGAQVRSLPVAGNTITMAIAADFQLDFAQADLLKLQSLSAERIEARMKRPAVRRAVDHFIAQLQVEITRSVTNHLRQAGAKPPAVLYLTGGGSLVAGLPEALAEKFQLRVERYDPLRKVEISPCARDAGVTAFAHRLAPLVGLARSAITDRVGATGLLPPVIRKEQAFRRRQPYWLGAAAALAWALLPPIRHYRQLAQATAAQTSAIQVQLQPLQEAANRNARHLAEIQATRDKIAVVRRLVEAKSNWTAFLADLEERLGEIEDGWLDELTLSPARPASPEWQLMLSGRLLDARNPGAKASPASRERARQLLGRLAGSPYVAAVTNERFDNSQPGLLRFDFTLVVNPRHPL